MATTVISPEQVQAARQRATELRDATYPVRDRLAHECDLVMKGGITSGVVYPLAACELAKSHRFRSIGGSSAGAIAACLVAAAEYGRDDGGFNRLAALPEQIGPTLPRLFRAGPRSATAHAALMAALDPSPSPKAPRVIGTLLAAQRRRFRRTVLAAVVLGVLAGLLLAGVPDDVVAGARFVAVLAGVVVVGVVIGIVLALLAEARSTMDGLASQGFGICVGSDGPAAKAPTVDDPGSLTDWLAAKIDEIAGVDRPLLVEDLRSRGVDLQVMTTNLSHGRPMSFPFDGRVFLFDPEELGAYFAPAVIDALLDGEPPATEGGVPLESADGRPLYHLPPADRLPVVLAARLSLSFPGLISAIPLYAVDFGRKAPADRKAVRCWFSDGGITSNFPVHFFDSMWPRRPTFALDLRGYHPDYPEADTYYAGSAPRAARVTRITSMPGFVSAILNTMQYWADDAQSVLPGYRDRIVEVHLRPDEGGMNLQMPEDVVAVLAAKGRRAAEDLASFTFEDHRWSRYLTTMGRLQDAVGRMAAVYPTDAAAPFDGYRDLIGRATTSATFQRSGVWATKAQARTEVLLAFAAADDPDFVADAPRPEPVLRITPRL